MLVACGGGGGGGTSATSGAAAGTAAGNVFSGTIATGAAYPKGTTITAYDKFGQVAATATTTDDTGSYSITIPADKQAPFVFAASAPDLDTLYSFSATGAAGNVNITSITNLIAARLSPTGNPENLSANASQITSSAVATQIAAVASVLAPLSNLSDPSANPITTAFSANGTGYDRLLDALKIKITPVSGGANVDITVASTSANPIVIPTFSASAATTATIPSLQQNGTVITGTIAANTLVASGTAAKVKDLVARIQTCFEVPLANRVTTNSSTAAGITAAACRSLFLNNDPASYKHNGFPVGVYANGNHWTGIFKSTETNRVWDLAKYEYTDQNGDIAISFRSKSADGSDVRFSNLITRMVGSAPNEQLKVVGNQYNYDANIRPQIHKRTFVNDMTYNYVATGYSVYVENKQNNGASAFDRVEVTSPATPTHPQGVKFTLKPSAGYSYLVHVDSNGGLTNSGTVILNLKPTGATPVTEATIISKTPTDWLWANRADWADNKISAIAQQTTWTFKYFNAGNTTTTQNATELRRTTERAPTLAELANATFADYTDSFLTEVRTDTSATGYYIFNQASDPKNQRLIDFSATGDLPAWTVPTGALAPRELGAWGRAPYINGGNGNNISNRYNDNVAFSTSARKTIIQCTKQSNADLHCQPNAVIGTPTTYATDTIITYFSLSAFGLNDRLATTGLALYKPSLNP